MLSLALVEGLEGKAVAGVLGVLAVPSIRNLTGPDDPISTSGGPNPATIGIAE